MLNNKVVQCPHVRAPDSSVKWLGRDRSCQWIGRYGDLSSHRHSYAAVPAAVAAVKRSLPVSSDNRGREMVVKLRKCDSKSHAKKV